MYKIKVSPLAEKQLKKLKIKYRLSVSLIINDLKDNPFMGKQLNRELLGKYSYRVGAHRIIYRISIKDNLVEIIEVGHRSTIYN